MLRKCGQAATGSSLLPWDLEMAFSASISALRFLPKAPRSSLQLCARAPEAPASSRIKNPASRRKQRAGAKIGMAIMCPLRLPPHPAIRGPSGYVANDAGVRQVFLMRCHNGEKRLAPALAREDRLSARRNKL